MTDILNDLDAYYMQMAFREAERAYEADEVPVGAVIVRDKQLLAKSHNQKEMLKDPTAHAEVLAVTQATAALETWRLSDCTMYVTLEPCVMCTGALVQARLKRLVYGTKDPKGGAVHSCFNLADSDKLNHRIEITEGIMQEQCAAILTDFFQQKRLRQKEKKIQARNLLAEDQTTDTNP